MKKLILLLAITTSLNAQVGIGTTDPEVGSKLHVVGLTRTDGFKMPTGATNGAVLTCDATGIGTWKTPETTSINTLVGALGTTGINIPTTTTQFLQTGSSITLPPGKYAVNISMLIRLVNVAVTPNSSSYWLRTSLSDSNGTNPTPTLDVVQGKLASGSLQGSSYYGLVNGTIIVNNKTTANKTYYYIAGNLITVGQNQTIGDFGGSNTDENRIIAYKIN